MLSWLSILRLKLIFWSCTREIPCLFKLPGEAVRVTAAKTFSELLSQSNNDRDHIDRITTVGYWPCEITSPARSAAAAARAQMVCRPAGLSLGLRVTCTSIWGHTIHSITRRELEGLGFELPVLRGTGTVTNLKGYGAFSFESSSWQRLPGLQSTLMLYN